MTGKRALVLAGGGIAGIAWETGVLQGISAAIPEAGRALLDADVLLGTSAGSTVAAQLGSGTPIAELYERQLADESHELNPGNATETVVQLMLDAIGTPGATKAQKLQKMGQAALAADTVAEPVRRAVIEARLPSHGWPQRILRVTGVDVETGESVVFDKDSGVDLVDAVAASCAVPGVWPPVTIGDRRFIDGGMASSVNLFAVGDCSSIVVLVPAAEDAPSPWQVGPAKEIAGFDGERLALFADAEAWASFGSNPLDPACRVPAAEAGYRQGRAAAHRVAQHLGL